MFKKIPHIVLSVIVAVTSSPVWAYDQNLAASYQKLFEPVKGANAGKALHLIKPEMFIEGLKKGKRYVAIDVRTRAESVVYTMALPGSLRIPANELFKTQNLNRLPTDKPVVVVCKSGTRATAVGTALRHIGFDNVYILKGGYKALTAYLDPKIANSPPRAVGTGSK